MFQAKFLGNGIIEFSGRLDAAEAEKADEELKKVTTTSTLDFKELDYISSAGLGILILHQKRLKETGNALKLKNLNKHIRDIFMYTGFDRIFEIEE
jgi:anti-anti-sigma factor